MIDPFRKNLGTLTDNQKDLVQEIKMKAKELHDLYSGIVPKGHELSDKNIDNRCISIAKEVLESSVMWAVKGFTKTD